ncbi:MAG: pyrroloquinoline quinone biosynthesis protein PqqE [Rhodospirillales bacterium]|nr:pyrroloquinoline quinone biosynthesis protein PqqE [Rhodospirillales bacterium]
MSVDPPLALLAEVTHRCPMRCLYCSNPLALEPASNELDTETWCRVLDQAADLGMLQVHFSGGEPTVRKDLETLIDHASKQGLYGNLITSGVLLDRDRLLRFADVGLEHVQLSFQDTDEGCGDLVGGFKGAHAKKLAVARWIKEAGLALTLNGVIHRHNASRTRDIIELAVDLGAGRLEVASVQYYGWGLKNRAYLMPTIQQLEEVTAVVEDARQRLVGVLAIDYVVPDYYARLPKACMGGWGQRFLNVDPAGRALPCHAAPTIPGMSFDTIFERSLEDIWLRSDAFNRFRGTAWMPEPCASCDHREIDWGGCRCQALALTGDAANVDPVCQRSPYHEDVRSMAESEASAATESFVYRGDPGRTKAQREQKTAGAMGYVQGSDR